MSKHDKDSLGSRMKQYEAIPKNFLMKRTPAIIRIDGRAFHTFTKVFTNFIDRGDLSDYGEQSDPFSHNMHQCMVMATVDLMRDIQGAVFAYTQSDEISILLRDWDKLETEQWFNGNIQKVVSVAASTASVAFNQACIAMQQRVKDTYNLKHKLKYATFDARVFNIPPAEVTNYFIWRQQDASRNSVQMLGHHHFSQKEMHGQNNSQVQDMLMLQKDINWNDIDTWKKRGTCLYLENGKIIVDEEIPIFTQQRDYVEQHLQVNND